MDPIERFLLQYKSPGTLKGYRKGIDSYFRRMKLNKTTYFTEDRDYFEDLVTYMRILDKEGLVPKSRNYYLSVAKGLIQDATGWLPTRRELKALRNHAGIAYPATKNDFPKIIEFSKIMRMGNNTAKTFFLMLASSGARISEIQTLTLPDIDLTKDPVELTIPAERTKNGRKRTIFISNEAALYLKRWLDHGRALYIQQRAKKTFSDKYTPPKDAVFPFTSYTSRFLWNEMLDRAGYGTRDTQTRVHIYRPHKLRALFKHQMRNDLTHEEVEYLLGHTLPNDGAYDALTPGILGPRYKAAQHNMLIETVIDTCGLDKRIDHLETERFILEKKVEALEYIISSVSTKKGIAEMVSQVGKLMKHPEYADFINAVEPTKRKNLLALTETANRWKDELRREDLQQH